MQPLPGPLFSGFNNKVAMARLASPVIRWRFGIVPLTFARDLIVDGKLNRKWGGRYPDRRMHLAARHGKSSFGERADEPKRARRTRMLRLHEI